MVDVSARRHFDGKIVGFHTKGEPFGLCCTGAQQTSYNYLYVGFSQHLKSFWQSLASIKCRNTYIFFLMFL